MLLCLLTGMMYFFAPRAGNVQSGKFIEKITILLVRYVGGNNPLPTRIAD